MPYRLAMAQSCNFLSYKKAAGVFSGCLGIQPHAHTLHGAPLEPRDLHL